MIQKLNNFNTDVHVNNIYDPTNVIKYKNGTAYYFFSNMKMDRAIDKKTNKKIDVVRFYFERAKYWEAHSMYDFKNGEMFTDKFEFVNINSISNTNERNNIIYQIKKHNPDYKFSKNSNNKFQFSNTKLYGDNINSLMRRLKDTHRNGGRDYKAKELELAKHQQQENMEHWKNNHILESLEKVKSYDEVLSIGKSIGYPDQKPQTIILKKHTHKKNNKIVIDEPVELGLDMSPRYIADEINHMWWGIPSSYQKKIK